MNSPSSLFPLGTQQELRIEIKPRMDTQSPVGCSTSLCLLQVQNCTCSSDLQLYSGASPLKKVPDFITWFCQLQRLLTKILSHHKILKNLDQPRVPEGTHLPTKGSLSPPEPLTTLTPHSAHGNRGKVFIAQIRPQLAKYYTLKICLKEITLKRGTWPLQWEGLHKPKCVLWDRTPKCWKISKRGVRTLGINIAHCKTKEHIWPVFRTMYFFFPHSFGIHSIGAWKCLFSIWQKGDAKKWRWHKNLISILSVTVEDPHQPGEIHLDWDQSMKTTKGSI